MQFYLLWPFVIIILSRLRAGWIVIVLLLGIVLDALWRNSLFNAGYFYWSYFALEARMTGLMLGAMLAYINWRPERALANLMSVVALLVIIASVYLLKFRVSLPVFGLFPEIASAMLIVSLPVRGVVLGKLFELLPFRVIGILSYGIYLWHYPISLALRDTMDWTMSFFYAATISTVLAGFSYMVIEKRWRKPAGPANKTELPIKG